MYFIGKRLSARLLVSVAVVSIGLIGWLVYYSLFTFHITGTNPSLSAVSSISPFIKVNFSQKLATSGLVVTSSDASILNGSSVNNKQLVMELNSMSIGKTYTIYIKSITSTTGKNLANQTLQFTVKDISYANLPKDQQAAIMARQNATPAINNDPIFNYTPHSTLDYNLTASIQAGGPTGTDSQLVLLATLLPSAADARSDEATAIAAYKQEVVDYIKSVGLDPTKYTIKYSVTEPIL